MKASISKGSSFAGALSYVYDAEKQSAKEATRVGGNMCGQSVAELSGEFAATTAMRPEIQQPVWHCSLSLAPGEQISPEKWNEVCVQFLDKMKIDSDLTPWVAVQHSDKDHQHVHLVVSRIQSDGQIWKDSKEVYRAIETTQELEKEFGLKQTKGFEARAEAKTLSRGEMGMFERTGELPPKIHIQQAVQAVIAKGPCTAPAFVDELSKRGVRAKPNLALTGTMNGFSFESGGVAFKGSQLGAGFKWSELQKNGISYDKTRDIKELRAASERANGASSEHPGIAGQVEPALGRGGDQHQSAQRQPDAHGESGLQQGAGAGQHGRGAPELQRGAGAAPAGRSATEHTSSANDTTKAATAAPGLLRASQGVSGPGAHGDRAGAQSGVHGGAALDAQRPRRDLINGGFKPQRSDGVDIRDAQRDQSTKAKSRDKGYSRGGYD